MSQFETKSGFLSDRVATTMMSAKRFDPKNAEVIKAAKEFGEFLGTNSKFIAWWLSGCREDLREAARRELKDAIANCMAGRPHGTHVYGNVQVRIKLAADDLRVLEDLMMDWGMLNPGSFIQRLIRDAEVCSADCPGWLDGWRDGAGSTVGVETMSVCIESGDLDALGELTRKAGVADHSDFIRELIRRAAVSPV